MELLGYFEEWSRRPGESVRMAVSTPHARVRAVLERILSGPGAKGQSKVVTEVRADVLDVTFPGRLQKTALGSAALLPLPPLAGAGLTVHAWIWPTVPERPGSQTVWSLEGAGIALQLAAGRLSLVAGATVLAASPALIRAKGWYSVAVVFGAEGVVLDVAATPALDPATVALGRGAAIAVPVASSLVLAAAGFDDSGSCVAPYNGKIEAPTVHDSALDAAAIAALRGGQGPAPTAAWAFGRDFAKQSIRPIAGGAGPGTILNGAERGVTGHNWDGQSDSFVQVPDQYQALQFHDDAMIESGWDYDLEFTLPADLKSGVYAVRLEAGEARERWPLFVRGPVGESADVLMLMPTNTYLAYGNERLAKLDFSQVIAHEKVVPEDEEYLLAHPELGRSCYDVHGDGSPNRYSSRRRPIIQVRPGYPNWLTDSYRHFAVDLYFIEWLERLPHSYHIATDEDLEREGASLLDRYKVLVTGSHPEYWTREGRDHLESWLHRGGRMMYLGGNGFYWVTTRDPARPWVVEIRRDNSGTRCWDAPLGERGHVYTGEQGGIWKNRGLGPNKLAGVGFSAEGWSKGSGFRRHPASYEGAGAAFFHGVNEDVVGDFGHVLGGAAGDEIDRFDIGIGSPAHAILLASSDPVGREYVLVIEEQILGLPDRGGDFLPDKVRGDIVYFPIVGGGAVFSVGSITCVGSMAWNDFDNNMARMVTNALDIMTGELPVDPDTVTAT